MGLLSKQHRVQRERLDPCRSGFGLRAAVERANTYARAFALGAFDLLGKRRQPGIQQLGVGGACVAVLRKQAHIDVEPWGCGGIGPA